MRIRDVLDRLPSARRQSPYRHSGGTAGLCSSTASTTMKLAGKRAGTTTGCASMATSSGELEQVPVPVPRPQFRHDHRERRPGACQRRRGRILLAADRQPDAVRVRRVYRRLSYEPTIVAAIARPTRSSHRRVPNFRSRPNGSSMPRRDTNSSCRLQRPCAGIAGSRKRPMGRFAVCSSVTTGQRTGIHDLRLHDRIMAATTGRSIWRCSNASDERAQVRPFRGMHTGDLRFPDLHRARSAADDCADLVAETLGFDELIALKAYRGVKL